MGRIRVLHPITRLIIGGAQENTMLTAELLDKARFDVAVISGPQTGPEGSLINEVRARGIPLVIEPTLIREIRPLKDLRSVFVLYRYIRRGRYTIVHTHSTKAGISGRWAAWLARVPVIVHTVHGWGHHDRQHPVLRAFLILVERITQRITDKLIVVSPLNTEKGLADGIATPDKYVTIRSGIELDRFLRPTRTREEMRTELGIPLDAPVVGTVARFSPQKAPLDFIQAMSEVAASMPEAHFVYVGDGPLRQVCEAAISEAGLTERFHLTGLRRDVPELLTTFDIFALSSLWEGLPRVLPQAMAARLPLVVTATDGSAEAVTDGVNGRLVPPGEPGALAQAVVDLLRNPTDARRMGDAGLSLVEEFGARRMVEQIAQLYEELLHQKGLT
ncbi:MAG: glycosyltransferase family 4 protein [Planctomycetota bacterium]|jgi:glycosyltransferase involved in cell wall biosynthesis